jgi:hypothetical protein
MKRTLENLADGLHSSPKSKVSSEDSTELDGPSRYDTKVGVPLVKHGREEGKEVNLTGRNDDHKNELLLYRCPSTTHVKPARNKAFRSSITGSRSPPVR